MKRIKAKQRLYDKLYAESLANATNSGFEFDAITGATFSSKGMSGAVALAAVTYSEKKGEIIGE